MAGPREAMTKEEYNEWDKTGKLPKRKKKTPPPKTEGPQPPKIDDQIKLKSIPMEQVTHISEPQLKGIRNSAGVMFTGVRITIQMGEKSVSGWMTEKDFRQLQVEARDKANLPYLHSLTAFGTQDG